MPHSQNHLALGLAGVAFFFAAASPTQGQESVGAPSYPALILPVEATFPQHKAPGLPKFRRHHFRARLRRSGTASVPNGAPWQVRRAIRAGNRIARLPYIWGGGHGSWDAGGYDCSGSVSYALHGGRLLDTPMVSGAFESWGKPGEGKWITVYANGGHMYARIAGLYYDTSGASPSRWQVGPKLPQGRYAVRHPDGL